MAKKNRTKQRDVAAAPSAESGEPGEVGPRQPCPCGSGKRYKSCHGAPGGGAVYVARPFEGLPSECDLVALRELVPAATAPLPLAAGVAASGVTASGVTGAAGAAGAERQVLLCSLLPMAAPAMVRDSGDVWLGLQVQHQFGDPSRDLAAVLLTALDAEPGIVGLTSSPGPGQRLQDLVKPDPLTITVHDGFEYWLADVEQNEDMAGVLEQANDNAAPTERLAQVEAAYWTRMGAKEHLRWVMPEPEGPLLDALSRLHVAGADKLTDEARLVGMFRAHGLLTPVWDLPVGTGAEALEDPAVEFKRALDEALADASPLSGEERAARNGLANRQVTIR